MIRDLVAGRIDVVFADPPLIQYVTKQQPELDLESLPVATPYDPELPSITGNYQVVIGLSQDAPELETCINKAIAEMWKTCKNLEIASTYGFSDKYWFSPPQENIRVGIDRPEGWQYPTLGDCK